MGTMMSAQHVQQFTILFKKFQNLEFVDHIWNHYKNCIQKSANMPGIGSLICEIDDKI